MRASRQSSAPGNGIRFIVPSVAELETLDCFSNPGASGCTYSNRTYTDDTFSYTMQCAGTFSIQSHGEVSFCPDTNKYVDVSIIISYRLTAR